MVSNSLFSDPVLTKRNSSVECFRLISMFLVLIVHLNGLFVGLDPQQLNFYNHSQLVIEAVSVICVNCFLIITGYYGIKFRWKSLWDLYIMLLLIKVPFLIVRCVYHKEVILADVVEAVFPLSTKNYFINSYVLLYLLSPVLNAFIDKYGKKIIKYSLLLFAVEFWFDCIRQNEVAGFAQGYRVLHFIVIYFLARTVYYYKEHIDKISSVYLLLTWIMVTLINILLISQKLPVSLYYTNPLVIIAAFCLFLIFERVKFHNSFINWLAKSTFAIYIIHLESPIATPYIDMDNYLLASYPYPIYVLCMIGMALGMMLLSITYDRVRVVVTGKATDKIYYCITNYYHKVLSNGRR